MLLNAHRPLRAGTLGTQIEDKFPAAEEFTTWEGQDVTKMRKKNHG
jgi:hypothetical protein